MSTEARYFQVGVFVLVGVALIGSCAVLLGGRDMFASGVVFETYFDESVQGLEVGSPVKAQGVRIGSVTYVGFVRNRYPLDGQLSLDYADTVLVEMELVGAELGSPDPDRLQNLIQRGLRFQLTVQGLTGTSYIESRILSPEIHPPMPIAWAPTYYYVPSTRSTIERISSAAERIMARLENVDVDQLVVDLDSFIRNLDRLASGIDTHELQSRAVTLLADMQRTSTELRKAFASEDVQTIAGDARKALEEFTGTMTRLQRMVDAGKYDVETTLENLRVTTENLRDLSETVREYPSLVILGAPPEPSKEVKP